MGPVRQWLLGVVLTAFAAALARQLAPEGEESAAVRLVGGLLLILALLRPLAGAEWSSAALEAGSFRLQTEEQARAAQALFASHCPDAELSVLPGGQPVYYFMISAE